MVSQSVVQYNPFMDEILYGDPYPVYKRMRAEEPVYYVDEYDAWFLSRFEDIWRAGPDFEHFSAHEGTTPPHLLTKDTPLNLSFASMDPPQHSRYRAQVAGLFKPGAVRRVEHELRPIVASLVDAFIERGECDLVQDFAAQVSVRGALSVIGLPFELAERASGWVNGIFAREDGHRGATPKSMEGAKDMFFTVLDHVKQSRKNPDAATGVMKVVMNSDVDGDKMDDFRLASLCCVVLIGGTDTLPKALPTSAASSRATSRWCPTRSSRVCASTRRLSTSAAPCSARWSSAARSYAPDRSACSCGRPPTATRPSSTPRTSTA